MKKPPEKTNLNAREGTSLYPIQIKKQAYDLLKSNLQSYAFFKLGKLIESSIEDVDLAAIFQLFAENPLFFRHFPKN